MKNVTLTTGGEVATLANGFTVTADTPVLTQVSPNTGQQGQQNLSVAITGQFTHFVQGTTTASFGAGISVSSLTVNSATSATAILNIAASATPGMKNVTLTTGGEVATLANGFTVTAGTPVLTQVSPNTGQQGQQNLSVTITGQFTHFVQGTTTASFGAGITAASLTVTSATSATAIINIAATATTGPRNVTLTTGGEVATLANGFTVTSSAPPASITSANPNTVPQGAQNVTITIAGLNTHFSAGISQASFGAGITVLSTFVVNSTSVKATINVDPAAVVGARTVAVTTGAETASLANGLTVEASSTTPPTATITSPTTGQTLSASTVVSGTVSGTGTLTWTLDYATGTSANFTTIATGSGAVSGTLGTFAADLLPNNPYTLRLTASNGQTANATVAVVVNTGATKMGRFTLTYQDIQLPGLGFPISVRRVYDSTNPNSGDFGYGWTLGYSSINITTDASFNVFITLPNGKRSAFAFTPQCSFFGCANDYTAAPGNYYSLADNDPNCASLFFSGGQWFCFATPYNPQNYILTAPDGTTYTITASGGITGITRPNGQSITIGPGGVVTNFGKSVVFARDGSGRITTITDPNNNKIQYAYDTLGRLSQVTDERGNVTTYSYAGSSTLISSIDAPGNCQPIRNDFDTDGRVISSTDASGNVTTTSYDSANNSETVTNPLGGAATYRYDTNGNLIEVDDPEGGKTSYTYDASNNIILVTFPSGRSISQTYDANGNLLTKTVVPISGPSLTTTYTWTSHNQLASVVFPSGSQQLFQFDSFGDLTGRSKLTAANTVLFSEAFTYDANANEITKTDGLGNTTNYSYDAVGNLLKQTDPANVSTSYTYDANGNVLSKTDGLGNTTTYQYDQANNLIATVFGGQTISSATWDSQGRLATFTDGLGKTTTYKRDCSENLTQVVDPLNYSTSYTYNGLFAITGQTDPNTHSTAFAYDLLDRYSSRTGPDGLSVKYAYTPDSGISQITLPSSVVQQFAYDGYAQGATETAPEKTIAYTYDSDGNITQTQETANSSTRTSTSTYDGIDRRSSYTDWAGRTVSYTYDNNSNPLTITAPDAVVTTNTYDAAGRLSKVQMGTASVQYTYDGDGRKSLETYSSGVTSAYAYDALGRLTSVLMKNAANAVIGSYAYAVDANSNRTSMTLSDGTVTYQYDADQRLTKEQSTSTSLGAYIRTESYDGAGNRLDAGDTFGPDNRLLTDSGGAYTYDNNGNRTVRGTQTYGYDSYNRLTTYAKTGTAATYEYDWAGRRVAKVVNGARREFVYDHARIIAEYDSGVAVAHYAFGIGTDEVAIVNRGGNNYFYHQDGLGSVVAITDSTGNVVQRYGYDAWGNMQQNTGSFAFSGSGLVNDFTYTGREYDDESGLYYYRSRSYDPAIGRFLQKDPQQGNRDDPQTENHYSYAGNSPVNRTDPSGEEELVEAAEEFNSAINKAAAAFVGFFDGFGVTNLEFLGQYLGLVNMGVSGPALDAQALALTEARVALDKEALGIVVDGIGDLKPPSPADGIPGAFATGFDLKDYLPGLAQKILETLDDLDIKLPVKTSFGGFAEGADAALERLKELFHP
jgi:RHS repeat-associated protein